MRKEDFKLCMVRTERNYHKGIKNTLRILHL